jgi:hypothetical protein
MKQFILIALTLMLFGCHEEPKQVYETQVKTYVISMKTDPVAGRSGNPPILYFQTPTSTECSWVDIDTYNKYKVGDTIQVLIKYWEKPKKK